MQNLLLRYDVDFKTFSNSINDLIQKELENQNDQYAQLLDKSLQGVEN
jgi:hypothetical protein